MDDFAASQDPISPSGVKSIDLLESAVSRQHTGIGSRLKYETPTLNAATLCYGVCCDHPFHNGNKRTALVATLCHLDANELMLQDEVSQDGLYELMVKIASHGFATKGVRGDQSDDEVNEIGRWIRKRTRRIEKYDRIITCRELKTILRGYGYELENLEGNHVDVVQYRDKRRLFGLRSTRVRDRIMRIPYPRDGAPVGRSMLKELRERCSLTERDGVDSVMFYSHRRPTDYFVTRYRKTLARLAKV